MEITRRGDPGPDGENVLEYRNVHFAYQTGPAILDDLTLTVRTGEFLSLLGPSGCGKSTVMNMAAGLLLPGRGTLDFRGRPLHGVNTSVGFMTQDDTLLPWMTVYDNIALALRIQRPRDRRKPEPEIRRAVGELLAMLDLDGNEDKYPAQLSGGMKRRALMARSFIQDPAMLLMDEPFGALDAQLAAELQQVTRHTVERLGKTILFVTHDIAESVLVSDRVIVMGVPGGRIVADMRIPREKGMNLEEFRFSREFTDLCQALRGHLAQARAPEAKPQEETA